VAWEPLAATASAQKRIRYSTKHGGDEDNIILWLIIPYIRNLADLRTLEKDGFHDDFFHWLKIRRVEERKVAVL